MARLPVDPRVARLLVVANRNGALREGLVIAAALSVVDPREYGVDPDAARRKHEELADPRSEFTDVLEPLGTRIGASGAAASVRCANGARRHYLSVARLREWHDVHGQLHELVQALALAHAQQATPTTARIHQAVLAAFIDFIAEHDEGSTYRGMRDVARAALSRARRSRRSGRAGSSRRSASRRSGTYLRTVAQVNPRWALQRRDASGAVRVRRPALGRASAAKSPRARSITLFGLTLASERRVDFGRIDPQEARRISSVARRGARAPRRERSRAFNRAQHGAERSSSHATARCATTCSMGGAAAQARSLRRRARRRGVLRRAAAGRQSTTARARRVVRRAVERPRAQDDGRRRREPRSPASSPRQRFPRELEVAGQKLPLRYRVRARHGADGLTLEVPRALLGAVRPEQVDWLVPGWLGEKVTALLRALPKEQRRPLVPLPDTAAELLARLEPRRGRQSLGGALREVLAEGSLRPGRVKIDAAQLDERALAPHLDDAHRGASTPTAECSPRAATCARCSASWLEAGGARAAGPAADAWSRTNVASWDFGDLPDTVALQQRRARAAAVSGPRGRCKAASTCGLLPPGGSAVEQHRRGVRRLLLKSVPQQVALDSRAHAQGPRARARVSRRRHERRARRRPRARERRRELRARHRGPHARTRSRRARSRAARSSWAAPTRCARCCARCCRCFASCAATSTRPSGKGRAAARARRDRGAARAARRAVHA